jgi:hypothetical protein
MTTRTRRMLFGLCALLASCGLILPAVGANVIVRSLVLPAGAVALLAGLWFVYHRLDRAPKIQTTLETMAWGIALSNLFYFPMYLLVRAPRPIVDGFLTRADDMLGIDPTRFVMFAAAHGGFGQVFGWIYESLTTVCIAALVVPGLAGFDRWASELLVALGASIVMSLLVLAIAQGIGPWVGGRFVPSANQAACESAIHHIKSGAPFDVRLDHPDPIVAFPSWHVILAVLASFTLARLRPLRFLSAAWLLLLVISTLTTGWHYVFDVLAGLAVSALAIAASRRLHSP